jgi:hypothetical protein
VYFKFGRVERHWSCFSGRPYTEKEQVNDKIEPVRISNSAPPYVRDPFGAPVFPYPIDNKKYLAVPQSYLFPDAQIRWTNIDPMKKQFLVVVHGFNVSEDQSVDVFSRVYKRVYWLGFRGNFLGFAWKGDPPNPIRFGEALHRAFRTSVPFTRFLATVRDWAGGPENVAVMAHSLGNFVMWDAVRIHSRYIQDGTPGVPNIKLVNSIISLEAAIWREAFEAQNIRLPDGTIVGNDLSYTTNAGLYSALLPTDVTTYAVDDLQKMSWRSWFRQTPKPLDPEVPILSTSIVGKAYHSYTPHDFALWKTMREWDWLTYGLGPKAPRWTK